jgi:hypothetical protein
MVFHTSVHGFSLDNLYRLMDKVEQIRNPIHQFLTSVFPPRHNEICLVVLGRALIYVRDGPIFSYLWYMPLVSQLLSISISLSLVLSRCIGVFAMEPWRRSSKCTPHQQLDTYYVFSLFLPDEYYGTLVPCSCSCSFGSSVCFATRSLLRCYKTQAADRHS